MISKCFDLQYPYHIRCFEIFNSHALQLCVLLMLFLTRSNGWGGLLPEEHAFSVLAALHRLCVRGSAGRCAVVYAFRSVFFTEWLIRQIEGRLDEALPGGSGRSSQVQPSLRHLVAILHALVLSDLSGAAAERFGVRILALANKAIRVLEPQAESAEGDASASLLEFALDSEGAEGGLGKAVRMGRRSADLETLKNLKELAAQLRPWRPEEESGSPGPMKDAKLMSSLILSKGARSLKRSANEERGSRRMALVLGGHAGATNGVEIPEVDFKASESVEHGDLQVVADDHERFPTDDLTELPLVAIRVLCRRAAAGSKEAMAIVLHDEEGMKSKDGLAQLVPWLIRCAGALNLNLEATILREDKKPVASIYATRRAHLQLLEAALPTCVHLLSGLRDAGLPHYRHTELCQTVLLLAQRLTSGLPGLAPRTSFSSDPEFRLLWRHCVVWLCRLFRLWFQGFPQAAGGQLLLPLLRHARVLPTNFSGGIMLLATCGTLKPVLPKAACHFSLKFTNAPASNGDGLQSRPVLLPTSTRTGNHAVVSLSHVSNGSDGAGSFGQFHHSEVQDWEGNGAPTDPLVQALAQEREAATAQALGLVELVNSRRERLSLDDVGELLALVAESALTSDAFLHLCTAKVMEKLTVAGFPVLQIMKGLTEAALNGVRMETEGREGREGDDISGGAARDQRDARAVSRLLLLLGHFGALSTSARLALTEHSVETLCQSVLAHTPATSLPPMAFSQSIRLLGLMFTSTQSTPSSHSVPKCRMVAKAVNLLINKASDSHHSSSTVSAALELLVGLCTPQWLCLNLLFSGSHENEDDKVVTVKVSSAFKLEKCMQRLAQELETATQQCRSVEKGSEDEAAALEDLAGWLQAVELMISLQRVVVENCPTSTVFLEVVLENSAASPGSLFGDVLQIMQGMPSGSEIGQVSRIVQAVTELRKELEAKPAGPVPSELPLQVFAPPVRGKGSLEAAKNSEDRSGYSQEDCANAVAEVVGLLDAAADLESSAEWVSVVDLDSTDVGDDTKMEWEFDAGVLRKKRQDFLEKFESDRRAKRLKQQQEKQLEKQRMEREEKTSGAPASQSPTDPAPREAPRQTGQTEKPERAERAEAAKKGAMDGKVNPAEALQGFLQDHPEFMRVLQNPKKCLADPRVKRMFVAELQNYPAVKSFLASQGLQL